MAILARFRINASPSTARGFDATVGKVLTLAVEAPSSLMNRVTFEVYNPADSASPLASEGADLLTLVGSTSGQKVDAANPAASVTVTMPGSAGARSWIVRCTVNGGLNARGQRDPELVFERMVVIRHLGRRKIIASEGTQYEPDGWAGAQGDDIDNPPLGTGDVVGAPSSVDREIVVHDGSSGKIIKGGNLRLSDIEQEFNVRAYGAAAPNWCSRRWTSWLRPCAPT